MPLSITFLLFCKRISNDFVEKKYFLNINFIFFAFNNIEEGINQSVSSSITNMTQKEFKETNDKNSYLLVLIFVNVFDILLSWNSKTQMTKLFTCLSINSCEHRYRSREMILKSDSFKQQVVKRFLEIIENYRDLTL